MEFLNFGKVRAFPEISSKKTIDIKTELCYYNRVKGRDSRDTYEVRNSMSEGYEKSRKKIKNPLTNSKKSAIISM